MKKNLIIIISIIITFISMLFGYAQKVKAEQSEKEALTQHEFTIEMKEQLEEQRIIAEAQRLKADQEELRAAIAEDSARVAFARAKKAEERCK